VSQALPRTRPYEPSAPPRLILGGADRTTRAEPAPSWRGVSHEKAFAVAPATALLLVSSAEGARAQVAAVVFAATMTGMLGVSALNHRAALGPNWQPWLRRADHAAINFFLAGTWTSVALVTLSGTARVALTALVWGAAAGASLITLVWVAVPGWIPATIAVGVGWSTGVAFLDAAAVVDPPGVALFLLGGVFYTSGALVYALRRPQLRPAFGYHEIFHLLVLAGVACHYLTLAFFVLPLAK
jgi:hemolysin III